jgi:Animal haem peroxidase
MKFDNDLPRDPNNGKAFTGDERNDENLPLAQTTVALIRFHNKVVDTLSKSYDGDDLFECARKHVVKHFQWIILHDFLPTVVDEDVLDCVMNHGLRWFKVKRRRDLFMPLEFSAAAFRFGHSMVRSAYQWNFFHSTQIPFGKMVPLSQLFDLTAFSGSIGPPNEPTLPGEWAIDWRRFYKFPAELGYPTAPTGVNMAARIDTFFDLNISAQFGMADLLDFAGVVNPIEKM